MKKKDTTLYNKEHLILFSRQNDDSVIWSRHAKEYIKKDKNYCFMGLINNDYTKIKNVLTGEVYNFWGVYRNGKVRINGQNYVSINLGNDFETTYKNGCKHVKIKEKRDNCDIYLLNVSFEDTSSFDDYAFDSFYGTMDIKSIQKLIDNINNVIDKKYRDNINILHQIKKQAKIDKAQRDF